jgi:hypothetical protein
VKRITAWLSLLEEQSHPSCPIQLGPHLAIWAGHHWPKFELKCFEQRNETGGDEAPRINLNPAPEQLMRLR